MRTARRVRTCPCRTMTAIAMVWPSGPVTSQRHSGRGGCQAGPGGRHPSCLELYPAGASTGSASTVAPSMPPSACATAHPAESASARQVIRADHRSCELRASMGARRHQDVELRPAAAARPSPGSAAEGQCSLTGGQAPVPTFRGHASTQTLRCSLACTVASGKHRWREPRSIPLQAPGLTHSARYYGRLPAGGCGLSSTGLP